MSHSSLINDSSGVVLSASGFRVYAVVLRRSRLCLKVAGSTLVTRDVGRTVRVDGDVRRSRPCDGTVGFRGGGRRRHAICRGDGSEWPRGRCAGERDAIYERIAGVLRESAESSKLLIVTSRSVREVSVVLVVVWSCWLLSFRYSLGLRCSPRLRYGRSGCRLSHKWWEGARVSRIQAEISRGGGTYAGGGLPE